MVNIPILTYANNTQPYADLVAAFAGGALPAARIFANGSLATIVTLAVHGVGIAAIPAAVIQSELKTGSLRLLKTEISLPNLNFKVITAHTKKRFHN